MPKALELPEWLMSVTVLLPLSESVLVHEGVDQAKWLLLLLLLLLLPPPPSLDPLLSKHIGRGAASLGVLCCPKHVASNETAVAVLAAPPSAASVANANLTHLVVPALQPGRFKTGNGCIFV